MINWTRIAIDSTFVRTFGGVKGRGENTADQGSPGVKHHTLVDANGVQLEGDDMLAKVSDVKELLTPMDSCELQDRAGEKQRHLEKLYADRAYDS